MEQIYLDREQCHDFGISYYEEGGISLPADVILRSKTSGRYDKIHQNFLRPLGQGVIYLSKTAKGAPGWYTVQHLTPLC